MKSILLLGLLGNSWQEDLSKATPEKIIERAIEAHGFPPGGMWRTDYKAVLTTNKGLIQLKGKIWNAGPRMMREELDNGDFIVLNQAGGWFVMDGKPEKMDKEELEDQREGVMNRWLYTLHPLLDKANKFNLETLPEKKEKSKILVGVGVKRPGLVDREYFFAQDTGLLTFFRQRRAGKKEWWETRYTAFQKKNGMVVPVRCEWKGSAISSVMEILDRRHFAKVDETLFQQPETKK